MTNIGKNQELINWDKFKPLINSVFKNNTDIQIVIYKNNNF